MGARVLASHLGHALGIARDKRHDGTVIAKDLNECQAKPRGAAGDGDTEVVQ